MFWDVVKGLYMAQAPNALWNISGELRESPISGHRHPHGGRAFRFGQDTPVQYDTVYAAGHIRERPHLRNVTVPLQIQYHATHESLGRAY